MAGEVSVEGGGGEERGLGQFEEGLDVERVHEMLVGLQGLVDEEGGGGVVVLDDAALGQAGVGEGESLVVRVQGGGGGGGGGGVGVRGCGSDTRSCSQQLQQLLGLERYDGPRVGGAVDVHVVLQRFAGPLGGGVVSGVDGHERQHLLLQLVDGGQRAAVESSGRHGGKRGERG